MNTRLRTAVGRGTKMYKQHGPPRGHTLAPQVTLTLDLKERTLRFAHAGRSIGTIGGVQGPLHAAVTVTNSRQQVCVRACYTPFRMPS